MSGMSKARSTMNLKVDLLAGDAAVTDIDLTDAEVGDEIIFVGHITSAAAVGVLADLTSEGSITSAGHFQMASTDTSSDQLWVFWNDLSGGIGYSQSTTPPPSEPAARGSNCYKIMVCGAGVDHDANLAVTGIETEDEIIFAGVFVTATTIATFTDETADCHITSSGYVQFETLDTRSNQVLIIWNDVSGGDTTYDAVALQITLVTGGNAAAELTCAGTATEDKIISMLHLTLASEISSLADLTSTASIPAAGKVASSTATNSDQLMVFWLDRSK